VIRGLLILCLLFAGCAPRPNDQKRPTSSLTKVEAVRMADTLCRIHAGLGWAEVTETHSMEPVVYGNFIIVYESVRIKDVKGGDIVMHSGAARNGHSILHQVYSNNGVRLGVAGVNNTANDNTDTHFLTDSDIDGRWIASIAFDPTKR
jgi:hypothetical protein